MNSNALSAEKSVSVLSPFVNSNPIVRSECMQIDVYHVPAQ